MVSVAPPSPQDVTPIHDKYHLNPKAVDFETLDKIRKLTKEEITLLAVERLKKNGHIYIACCHTSFCQPFNLSILDSVKKVLDDKNMQYWIEEVYQESHLSEAKWLDGKNITYVNQ